MARSYDSTIAAYSFVTGSLMGESGADTLMLLRQVLPPVQLVLGLLLSGWTLLFLFRIVLTWYPQVDLSQGLWRVVAIPTEPLLAFTRRLIAPIGGVDVTPVIWLGLISLVRELLVGQQGLITQVVIRISVLPA